MKNLKPELIIKIVCDYFKIAPSLLLSKTRKSEIIRAKYLAMYFIYQSGLTLEKIGFIFVRDHATILHAKRSVVNLCETDKDYKTDFDNLVLLLEKQPADIKEALRSENKALKSEVARLQSELNRLNGSLKTLQALSNLERPSAPKKINKPSYHSFIDSERQEVRAFSGYKAVRA
jgi:hypothetical protein